MKNQNDLLSRLAEFAMSKSHAFCYGCYTRASSGTCLRCGSDDLMRELPGVGVEWGVDWMMPSLLKESLSEFDVNDAFEQSLEGAYPETTQVGWLTLDTITLLKEWDPIAWQLAESEWVDEEENSGNIVSVDAGATYYEVSAIEEMLSEAEEDVA